MGGWMTFSRKIVRPPQARVDDRQICQLSGEILLHQLIYPLPGLGRASTVIDLDVCVDAQNRGVVRDGRAPIDLCARMLYRVAHMGRHTP